MTTSNEEPGTMPAGNQEPYDLNEDQRRVILSMARAAIEGTISESSLTAGEPVDEALIEPAAVFVTLWQMAGDLDDVDTRKLRGCIGRLQPDYPLYLAVRNAAVSAATRDPRFSPVRIDELDSLTIEIALLSPMEEVHHLQDIVIGRDGLVIEAHGRRGLLLPKVATRLGWDREEFLYNVCLKAGLPPGTWPDAGTLHRFCTTVFHE